MTVLPVSAPAPGTVQFPPFPGPISDIVTVAVARPGDLLVLSVPTGISVEQVGRMREALDKSLPAGVRALVVAGAVPLLARDAVDAPLPLIADLLKARR